MHSRPAQQHDAPPRNHPGAPLQGREPREPSETPGSKGDTGVVLGAITAALVLMVAWVAVLVGLADQLLSSVF